MSAREDAERIQVSLRTVSGILEQLRLGLHEQVSRLLKEAQQRQSAAPPSAAHSQQQGPAAEAAAGDSNVIPDSEEEERRAMDQAADSARSLGQGSADKSFEGTSAEREGVKDTYDAFESEEDLEILLGMLLEYPQPRSRFVRNYIDKVKRRLAALKGQAAPVGPAKRAGNKRRVPIITGKRVGGDPAYGGPSRDPPRTGEGGGAEQGQDRGWEPVAEGRPAASQDNAMVAAARAAMEGTESRKKLQQLANKWKKDANPRLRDLAESAEERIEDLGHVKSAGWEERLARLDATRRARRERQPRAQGPVTAARKAPAPKNGPPVGVGQKARKKTPARDDSAEMGSAQARAALAEALATRGRGGVQLTGARHADYVAQRRREAEEAERVGRERQRGEPRVKKEPTPQRSGESSGKKKKKRRAVIESESE